MRSKPKAQIGEDRARDIVEQHDRSGLTRQQFCERTGIPVTTLDYYRQRRRKAAQKALVPVTVVSALRSAGFTIVLGNGRRIESQWEFDEAVLNRLVQLLERV